MFKKLQFKIVKLENRYARVPILTWNEILKFYNLKNLPNEVKFRLLLHFGRSLRNLRSESFLVCACNAKSLTLRIYGTARVKRRGIAQIAFRFV